MLEGFCSVANTGIANNAGYTSALFFYKYADIARQLGKVRYGSDRVIRNGMQLVSERALYDYLHGVDRKVSYDPAKIKPCAYTEYIRKHDKEEMERILGRR